MAGPDKLGQSHLCPLREVPAGCPACLNAQGKLQSFPLPWAGSGLAGLWKLPLIQTFLSPSLQFALIGAVLCSAAPCIAEVLSVTVPL